jgi:hypothetical protein
LEIYITPGINAYRERWKSLIRSVVIAIFLGSILLSGCITSLNPEKGSIQVTSSPTGAELYIDHQFQGSTPGTIAGVEPGNHTLELRSPGYQSWSSVIAVPSGTSNYFAALVPLSAIQIQGTTIATIAPVTVTIRPEKELMLIGDTMTVSGTCTGSDKVVLTLYGPGKYSQGIGLAQADVNSLDAWSYTWRPGTSVVAGDYTMVAEDPKKTTVARAGFSVIGGGVVSIASNSYSAAKGDTLRFSGRCTSGAQNVRLVLYGPDRFSSGVELGTFSVLSDKTWSFRYMLDTTMPTGIYTIYVYDIPNTSSGNTQFTVGFRS